MFPLRDDIPTERTPWLTIALIVANVVVFVISLAGDGDVLGGPAASFVVDWGVIPYELTNPDDGCVLRGSEEIACGTPAGDDQPPTWVTVLTSMFLHGGLLHLAGNMLFLWIFGNNIEDAMGRIRFIAFYLLGGAAAVALQTAAGPQEAIPLVGASGAVAAVLGGYLLLYPRARVLTAVFLIVFFAFINIPALLFLFIWFAQQALFAYFDLTDPTGEGGGVAYFAHIGGFVFGLVAIKLFANRHKRDYLQRRRV